MKAPSYARGARKSLAVSEAGAALCGRGEPQVIKSFNYNKNGKSRSANCSTQLAKSTFITSIQGKSSPVLLVPLCLLLALACLPEWRCEAAARKPPAPPKSNTNSAPHSEQLAARPPTQHQLQREGARFRRAATARLDRLWDDAVIPFEIDPLFNDERASLFRAAMRHWENNTCIKFVERVPEEHRNYIVFTERSCGCCSFVGKRGNGAQAISIGKHCDKFGIVVHELGHVVGFWHEHTRPDRDQHVQIIGKNIMAGQEYNFNKLTKDEVNSLGLAYDYDSILHYATNTFAKDTYLDTILPLHGPLNTEEVGSTAVGQGAPLSAAINNHSAANSGLPDDLVALPGPPKLAPGPSPIATPTHSSTADPNGSVPSTGGQEAGGAANKQATNNNSANANGATNAPPSAAITTSPHMINDQARAAVEAIRRQIDLDFQSMLQFNGTTGRWRKSLDRARALGGGKREQVKVVVSGDRERWRRSTRTTPLVDVDDGLLMLSSDNMLAKTRPEIGQRVRLSVGDIAQTNLLYRCPKCGRTIQQLSGMFYSPNYYTTTAAVGGEQGQQARANQPADEQQQQRGGAPSNQFHASQRASSNRNDLCEWRLTVGQGERIMLTIADLDIARKLQPPPSRAPPLGLPKGALSGAPDMYDLVGGSALPPEVAQQQNPMIMNDCVGDYLEVRDGYTFRALVIARLCGHIAALRDVIRPIVSTSNRLLVTFRTTNNGGAVGRRGFLAHHETICGGLIVLGNPSPMVYETPGSFAGAQRYSTLSTSQTTSAVAASHHRPNGSHQAGASSGSNHSQEVTRGDLSERALINGTSPSENEVLLSSQTNVRLSPAGHQAQQQQLAQLHPDAIGSDRSHNHFHNHNHQIQATNPAHNLSAPNPSATVSSLTASLSTVTAATEAAASTTTTTTTTTTSTTTSSSSTTSKLEQPSPPGQLKLSPASTLGLPVLNSTVIQSPNWPEHYRASRECLWQIRAEENHQISMRFDTFDLEPHDSCAYDYVEIRDGDSMTSDLLGRFCGNRAPSQVLSSGSSMLVKFVSDSDVNKAGFFASVQPEIDECKLGTHGCSHKCSNSAIPFRCECPNGLELGPDGKVCVPTCGGIRNDSTGQITSPSFPDLYPISTRCVWEIIAPANHRITLNFTYFDLEGIRAQECDYDFVGIWSKTLDGKYVKNGIYCGLNQAFSVTSIGSLLRIEFNSDNSIQKSGFEANYFIDRDECSTNNGGCQHACKNLIGSYQCFCNNGFVLHENKHDCIGGQHLQTITAAHGTFHSPNFPNTYEPNKEYAWIFSTMPGHRIKLVFDQFDLESHQECAYDHVAVFDGEGADDHALGRFCGSRRPLTLVSSFNMLYLVFQSDATNEKRGFNATHSTMCGGRLQANLNQLGHIYSHPQFNGTAHYDRNEDCDWIIEANENQRVRIEFTFFALEADSNCNYDQTIVYDGSDNSASQLARLCGADIPKELTRLTSSGGSMLIVFKSDDSINSKGFALTYTALEVSEEETLASSYGPLDTRHQQK